MPKTFNDPLFSSQWYLLNTGQRGGPSRLDINVISAWDKYTGKGVTVAINDDGMDLSHPAILANLLTNLAFDGGRGTTGQGFIGSDNEHGTVVGSIVGMAGNDGVGGVGVAYEAKLVPNVLLGKTADGGNISIASVFLANMAAGAGVSVNSWGIDPAFGYNFTKDIANDRNKEFSAALVRVANEARDGLGMIIVTSSGNERKHNADAGLNNFTNNKISVVVGAVTEMGIAADYSAQGASLLITAPGGDGLLDQSNNNGFGILAADIQGTGGFNKTQGSSGDYAFQNVGTSYSGPMVGGATALMLQANPNLGFRDVSSILALTARQVDVTNTSWVRNGATDWNLGSMHFSRDYGFGLLDVSAAVRLAESWSTPAATMANWQSVQGVSTRPSTVIADNSPQGLTVQASLTNNIRIERMEFDLWLEASSPSQLSAAITSPSGTTVTLFDRPLNRDLVENPDGTKMPDMNMTEPSWPYIFTIGSTAFLGESSAGTWRLKLTDHVAGTEATYHSLAIRAWGTAVNNDSQYIFTNASNTLIDNRTLTDIVGVDTVNAAAVDVITSINLTGGSQSSIGTGKFTISPTSIIENAIGGLGNDALTGNAINNILRGNGGNDAIDGGAGIDRATYSGAVANYTITVATGATTINDKTPNRDGTDTLTNIERLKFSDKSLALDLAPTQSAGQTALLLGAVLPGKLVYDVSKQALLGNVMSLFDQGFTLSQLSGALLRLPVWDVLTGKAAPTNADIAGYLVNNVYGGTQSAAVTSAAIAAMNAETPATQGNYLASLAASATNQTHVNLVGIQATGLEYLG